MQKINFPKDVLPHAAAIGIFLIVTFFFFNPVFFENKVLDQSDIQQWEGSSKSMRDYREKTGDEPLWAESMFSGMPGYMVNVTWGNVVVGYLKRVISFGLPHPVCNIYLAFLSYYIMLLAFRVRPFLAIAGALAFGLSSYMIIGLSVGHSSRIGAIAFMPLVMAGIHLAFTNRRVLGFGLTAAALALHFRENHPQITYYLVIIVLVYGIVQLIACLRAKNVPEFFRSLGVLVPAAMIAVGTFFGPLWALNEYTKYTRGQSELSLKGGSNEASGVGRSYAFQYNYAIAEPMTLLIPNFYGGSSRNLLIQDRQSNVYKAMSSAGNQETFNQLAYYTSAYWGPQTQLPYYAGAIIVFLFAVGIAFAEKKYVWWLVPVSIFAIMLTWGSNFPGFNYFMFDHLPGYNKFRSVTFGITIVFFSLPLLGFLGLEKLLDTKPSKENKRKLLIAFAATGGTCLFFLAFAGIMSFMREEEQQHLPGWFIGALADDRKSLLRSDAFRSFAFIAATFIVLYFEVWKKLTPIAFYAFMIFMITIDIAIVDHRHFTKDNYKRKRGNASFTPTAADQEILKDKSYYRVFNLQDDVFLEARTSYFHHSIGGYHAVKLRRYQELFDSCLLRQRNMLIEGIQAGNNDFSNFGVINMLNAKYLVFGPEQNNIIPNSYANGNAWFVREVVSATSPDEELNKVCTINTRRAAVVNDSRLKPGSVEYDSAGTITIVEHNANALKYESQSAKDGLAVFSEIFYPSGWIATIDGQEVPIIRANYVLRALQVPGGKHTIEFHFRPAAYVTGNTITTISSWLVLLVLIGSIGWSLKEKRETA